MKLNPKSWLVAGLLSVSVLAPAQNKFGYKRPIEGVKDVWHRLEIPEDLYSKMNPDFSDLRIIGVLAEGDSVETPYIVRHNRDELVSGKVDTRILNQSRQGDLYFWTLELKQVSAINQLLLDIGQSNFDWRVQLEGSADGREWFSILENYRILGIQNNQTHFIFSELNFPLSSYAYYRVGIRAGSKPELKSAQLFYEDSAAGVRKNYAVQSLKADNKKAEKRSELYFELEHMVPVSLLKIHVRDTFDYFRSYSVYVLTDSVQTEQGWHHNYKRIYSGTLHSLQENIARFSAVLLQKGKIEIANGDNTPLQIDSLSVQGYGADLVARFTSPADYALYYGNRNIVAPSYDLVNFTDKIPSTLSEVKLGNEIRLLDDGTVAPLFENRAWLWAVMLVLIALMGWFTFSMLKKKS